jgi:beta-glucanase (GH16 family)
MKLLLAAALMLVISAFAAPSLVIAPADAIAGVSTATDACGVQPLKADGTAWQCTFNDNFTGAALDRTKWEPQTHFRTGSVGAFACYVDSPYTVAVANGSLHLTVRKLARAANCGTTAYLKSRYVAGMVSTYHLFSQQYGRFEARMKNRWTKARGLHEAFWLWPDDRDQPPTSGAAEIDVSETYSLYPNLSIPYLHYGPDSGPEAGVNTAWDCAAIRGQWNTYTLEWSASRIEIFVNGKSCLVNTSGDRAFMQPYIVALTAALGTGTNSVSWLTPLPATTSVDYVRVWR